MFGDLISNGGKPYASVANVANKTANKLICTYTDAIVCIYDFANIIL